MGTPCKQHPERASCKLPEPMSVDLCEGCGPCQPYSRWRSNHKACTAKEHALHRVTFGAVGSILSTVEVVQPRMFISEQVEGFEKPYADATVESLTPLWSMVSRPINMIPRSPLSVTLAPIGNRSLTPIDAVVHTTVPLGPHPFSPCRSFCCH